MYPQHEKLAGVVQENLAISEFLEWLADEGICLAKLKEHTHYGITQRRCTPIVEDQEQLLIRFFGIDRQAFENEKGKMLDGIRIRQGIRTRPHDCIKRSSA